MTFYSSTSVLEGRLQRALLCMHINVSETRIIKGRQIRNRKDEIMELSEVWKFAMAMY